MTCDTCRAPFDPDDTGSVNDGGAQCDPCQKRAERPYRIAYDYEQAAREKYGNDFTWPRKEPS